MTLNISEEETETALKGMKSGKAVGADEIPAEAWKCIGNFGIKIICKLFNSIMNTEQMPSAWRQRILIPMFKGKGDIQECKHYRGIKLLSHTFKIWERVVGRMRRQCTNIHESQFGFMPGRSTADAIFILKQTTEKHREGQKNIRVTCIDLEKAYDSIPREEIWRSSRERNVPEKYIRLIQDMYQGCKTVVRSAAVESNSFGVEVGLHQGSALSPYLFLLLMDVLTQDVRKDVPGSMMFADDIGQDNGQEIDPVKILGEELQSVHHFKYLGSSVEETGGMATEITPRVNAAWRNWKRCSGVLCDRRMPVKLKGKVYKTVVRPALLYGAETWTTTRGQEARLEVNEMRMLRWMCGVTRRDKIRNEHIGGTTRVAQASKKITEKRLKWYGHVRRMKEEHIVRRMLDVDIPGKKRRGRPNIRWENACKRDMTQAGLKEDNATNRAKWRKKLISYTGDPR